MNWRFVHYVCPGGECPVYEFLRDLRSVAFKSWAVFEHQRRVQLEENGPMMGPPYWENVGGGLGEIRWSGANRAHYRIYASTESNRRIVMYLGVDKRWRAFTNAHRKQCEQYRADFRSANYDEQKRELKRCGYYNRRGEPI